MIGIDNVNYYYDVALKHARLEELGKLADSSGQFTFIKGDISFLGSCESPKEAAIQWGIFERRMQLLCTKERISGTIKFGRVWAIPLKSRKSKDLRKNPLITKKNNS